MRRSSCLCWCPWRYMRMRVRSEISASWTTRAWDRGWKSTQNCRDCSRRIDPLRIAWYTARESRVQIPNERWRGYQGGICFSGRKVDARRTTWEIGKVENIG